MQSYQLSKIILEKVRSNYWSKVLITLKQKWKGFYPVFYVLNLESWQLVLGCPFEAKKKKKKKILSRSFPRFTLWCRKCNFWKLPIRWIDLEKVHEIIEKFISNGHSSTKLWDFLFYCVARASLQSR